MSKPIESAEEFWWRIDVMSDSKGMVELATRDAAMKLEGKRELLAEITTQGAALAENIYSDFDPVHFAFDEAARKYATPVDGTKGPAEP